MEQDKVKQSLHSFSIQMKIGRILCMRVDEGFTELSKHNMPNYIIEGKRQRLVVQIKDHGEENETCSFLASVAVHCLPAEARI